MQRNRLVIFGWMILLIFMSCATSKKSKTVVATTPAELPKESKAIENKEDAFFIDLFKKYPGVMDSILAHRKDWKVQIIYTQINRNANGIPSFTHHYFNRISEDYFYPASTVKFPVALLALEKLNYLKINGLDKYAAMITEAAYSGQTPVYNDPNTSNGKPSIAQYIKRILLVSDNDAYNRLYEFLGQEHINSALQKKGYANVQLLHRLSVLLSEDENRHSNPVSFFDNSNRLLYSQPMLYNKKVYAKRNDLLGKAFYSNGKLVNEPMNFSTKNKIALADLHQVLLSLVFPQAVSPSQRFNLTEPDRRFVLQYMSQLPSESVYPSYDSSYNDAYAKFILYGSEKGSLPKNIRIFNKVGNAYGQLTDVAYIVDFEKKLEFMVSATIYCNRDEILNDDKYDYNNIGYPFMKNMGKILYDYEVKRKRNFQPDLSSLIFTYDK